MNGVPDRVIQVSFLVVFACLALLSFLALVTGPIAEREIINRCSLTPDAYECQFYLNRRL